MRRGLVAVELVVVLLVATFGAGYVVGRAGATDYRIYTGDCWTGERMATCFADGIAWGVSGTVPWTDAGNVGRGGDGDPSSWPTCLPLTAEPKGVRFAGAVLPITPGLHEATIVWVDCRR